MGGTYRADEKTFDTWGTIWCEIQFRSNDNYLRISSRYYQNNYSLSGNVTMLTENYDGGKTSNPLILYLDASYYSSSNLRAR